MSEPIWQDGERGATGECQRAEEMNFDYLDRAEQNYETGKKKRNRLVTHPDKCNKISNTVLPRHIFNQSQCFQVKSKEVYNYRSCRRC